MAMLKNCVNALVSICVLLNLTTKAEAAAAPTYTATHCTNTTTYAPDSAFETNLNILFYYFSNNVSQSNGYFLTIVGFSTTNAVSGLFLCRGDVSSALCEQCVATAAKEIRRRCTEALIWYDECTLRYTNKYFPVDSIVPRVNLDDGKNIPGVDFGRFNRSLYGFLNDLATKAAGSQSKKFAAGEAVVTDSVTVYGLEQCTNDLTNSECERCLRNAIGTLPSCCVGKQGARALLPSFNVRYQLYPFFTLSSPPSSGERKLGPGTVAVVVVVPVVSLILLVLGCYFYFKRRSKKKLAPRLLENLGDEITTLESLIAIQFGYY